MLDWIRAKFKRQPETETKTPDPQIAAEQLMIEVFPPYDYLSLAAWGYCDVQGKKYKYRLRRNDKTIVTKGDGSTYTACIHPVTATPDADRLVSEYILIVNDEPDYLRTANLSPTIQQPQPARRQARFAARLVEDRLDYGYVMATTNGFVTEPAFLTTAHLYFRNAPDENTER